MVSRRIRLVVGGLLFAVGLVGTIGSVATAWQAYGDTQRYLHGAGCVGDGCRHRDNAKTEWIAGRGSGARLRVTLPGFSPEEVAVFEDYGLVAAIPADGATVADILDARIVAVWTRDGRHAALSRSSPQQRGDTAAAIAIPALIAALLGAMVLIAATRSSAPAKPYPLPHTVRIGAGTLAFLASLPVVAAVAIAFDPFRNTLASSAPDLRRMAVPLLGFGALGVIAVGALLRQKVTVMADRLILPGRRELPIADIEAVNDTGRGLLIRAKGRPAVGIPIQLFGSRERSTIVEALKQAPGIDVRSIEKIGRPGNEATRRGLWGATLWTANRLSDRPSTLEIVGTACGIAVALALGVGAALLAVAGERGWSIGLLIVGALLALITSLSAGQLLYRRRLRSRLASGGVSAHGRVTAVWTLPTGYGESSALAVEFTAAAGTRREVTAWDNTRTVLRWHLGDQVVVHYLPDDPKHVIIDPPQRS